MKESEDYENIDWSLNNGEIARQIGRHVSSVWWARKRRGIPSAAKRGETKTRYIGPKRKPIDDLDYEFAFKKRKDGRNAGSASWKKAVLRYLGKACTVCKYYKPLVNNHCHHISPLSEGGKNTIRNGIVLCSRCHDEVHAGIIDLKEYTKLNA